MPAAEPADSTEVNVMRKIRIFFSKTGDAKYISHLDLMRCMTRAVIRAGIPIGYTEGFNPRPYMNFAMPLSIFFEGLCEIVDIRVDASEDEMSDDEIKNRLSDAMPKDIKILSVKAPVKKASEVAFSSYRIEILQDEMDKEAFNDAVSELISRDELMCSKLGKKGKNKVVKYINLTEHINSFNISVDEAGVHVITLILPSNPTFGVKPSLLTDKIFEELKITPVYVHITRLNLLDSNFDNLE